MEAAAAPKALSRLARSLAAAEPYYSGVFVFFAALVAGALVSACWMSVSARLQVTPITPVATQSIAHNAATGPKPAPGPPRFTGVVGASTNQTPSAAASSAPPPREVPVPATAPPAPAPAEAAAPPPDCPSYFRWIHEDLRPWSAAGVTRDAVEGARRLFAPKFRVTVVAGRLYVALYGRCFQTRAAFTQWGILQLLRRYPCRVPDLDLMFDCEDLPVVSAGDRHQLSQAPPSPLFRYCGSETTLDIAFPDWSFWGWAPYAYWKGNPKVGAERLLLLRCNASGKRDWNAQDWGKEVRHGFRGSDLSKQCTHRYKIYIEGSAWSISEKYILACDSMTLLVTPRYYDFFSRSLMPIQHYWPVRDDNKCASIKYAVDWGNSHKQLAQRIGKQASNFIQEELSMDHVYDYMLHLLTEYAKLLKFKPTKPPEAVDVCSESLVCQAEGLEKKFLMKSMVMFARDAGPCDLPPPFDPHELKLLKQRKENSIKQIQMWEQRDLGS
ncbi:unnamed protein product [Miscanthus lutarioriparius]|uniref:Glycosyl transferase CAP10 domain-containing protein n=1 Tax=Miscanthus lutarioriparius TaxID=422564 RepID=A0A811QVE2_9POAL|nr:unnamed protein product [Miscanthus lutarioriparius]